MPVESAIENVLKEAEKAFALKGASGAISCICEKLPEHMDPSGYDLVKKALEYYEGRMVLPAVLSSLARVFYEYVYHTYNTLPAHQLAGPLLFAIKYGDSEVKKNSTALLLAILGGKYISFKVIGTKAEEIIKVMGVEALEMLLKEDKYGILSYGNEEDYSAILLAEGIPIELKKPIAERLLLMIISNPLQYHRHIEQISQTVSGDIYLLALFYIAVIRLAIESGELSTATKWIDTAIETIKTTLNQKKSKEEISVIKRALEYLLESLVKIKHNSCNEVLQIFIETSLVEPDNAAHEIESILSRFRKERELGAIEKNELVQRVFSYGKSPEQLKIGELLKIIPLLSYNSIKTHIGEIALKYIKSPDMKIQLGSTIREIAVGINDRSALIEADIAIATGYVELAKIDLAKKFLEEVCMIELENPQVEFNRIVRTSELYIKIGDFEKAGKIGEKGVALIIEGK
ncbi:MAG: hypothetical protein QXL15_00825, partial [Candidatus Korarchaeota archaeon]